MPPPPSPPVADDLSAVIVGVPVTCLWVSPGQVREVDAPMLGPLPDPGAWLAGMDSARHLENGRLGLHGRVESQLVEGEPVLVVGTDESGRWSQVLAPWQPSPGSERGYPGWVPSAHLRSGHERTLAGAAGPDERRDLGADSKAHPAVGLARRHLGLPYLWGGLTPLGFDCSGLVHHLWRGFGAVVPRDAHAQAAFTLPVPLHSVRSGDLYFFAHPDQRIHHVGIVVRPARMVHASESGAVLTEEDLGADRFATLVAAGRLDLP